ncbi:hypothetical protein [Heyndrickxia oleronia]|uniref:hypothetical protein n=1 Tax=Heyndrickxia oleronia TaxID=38875 RepID=UPI001C0F28E2|nr:hypothetical protein [Heyndrickxia oleronia]MBU5211084.1 hypothetical protein [Heyndrickxia oleronia]
MVWTEMYQVLDFFIDESFNSVAIRAQDGRYVVGVSSDGGGSFRNYTFTNGNYNNPYETQTYDFSKYDYRVRVYLVTDTLTYYTGPFIPLGSGYTNGQIVAQTSTFTRANPQYIRVFLERQPKNSTPTTPGAFTQPSEGTKLKGGQTITIAHGASTDAEGHAITYETEASYNGGTFTNIRTGASTNFQYTISSDKTKTSVQFRVRAKDSLGAYSAYRTSPVFTIVQNSNPTLTLNSPSDNTTLYETDTLNIEGYAADVDNGNIVNARYQLNGGTIRALATGISTGSNTIPFNKQLTFRGGKLYDGDTAVTDELAEGVAHQLKVWSEDDQGGKSPEQLRHFYVVPNRPPALTIDPFATKSDLINADKVTISGTASDPDGNTVVVSYKLNKGMSTEVYRGKDGAWSFDLSLKDLVAGENTVAIEVVDSYNSKTSKTLKLNKNRVATPLLTSEVRYKIDPPSGTAKGVLLWVQRDVGLTVTADISMGLKNEQETYEAMTLTNTAPVSAGVVEDEFVFEATAEKDNIMLKLTLSRESADVNDAITPISGVLS